MVAKHALVPFVLAAITVGTAFGVAQQSLEELPSGLRQAMVEAIYRVAPDEGAVLEAPNPAQGMQSAFTAQGVQVSGEDDARGPWTLSLSLEAWGRPGSMQLPEPAKPTGQGRRVEYRRGPVTEWYVNDERGLEQGFTLDQRPLGEGPLVIALAIGDGFTAEVEPGGRDALFRDPAGTVLRYTGLRAWDSAQQELEASLVLADGLLAIRVEDDGAVYPLHIDPCIAAEEAKLIASDAMTADQFGFSVAISGDTAVIGAQSDDHAGLSGAGSAYVFVRSGTTWSEQQKLIASDAASGDNFGSSVAVSGDTAVVGSSSDDGSAYVFVRSGTTWTEQQKLTASDPAAEDLFGSSVAVSGDTAIVGAYHKDQPGGDKEGAAYVFVRSGTTWSEQQKLTASDAAVGDVFGWSVAVSGDTAVVGAYLDDHAGGKNAGSAYAFVRSGTTWTEQQKLTASDSAAGDLFGWSVAVSGDTAVVVARADDHSGISNAGSAYVFVQSGTTWSEQQRLTASDPDANDAFGYSIAVSGNTTVVGAQSDDNAGGIDAGSAYVYVRSGTSWTEQQKLTASDPAASDFFGNSVGVSGDTVVAGAVSDDHAGGASAGSAYVFRSFPAFAASNYCTAGTSASGCQASLSACGIPSATAAGGFSLQASTVEGQKEGLFFFGTNGQQANPWGNGTSSQCVVPPVVRTGILTGKGTLGVCDGTFAQDLNALWCSTCPKPQKNPGSGAVVQAQLWYRDPLSTSNQTTSMSDAIEFSVAP